jgi:DNA (cytosine-5)-methyltransferase 1
MSNTTSAPIAIELFAGAGGLSEGLQAAGIQVVLAVEKHPDPALTYAFNHPGTTVLCGDIRRLSMESLESHVRTSIGDVAVDIVVGGPPCQGYSPAGKRNRKDPRNRLFKYFVHVIEHFQPRLFLFENVPGFAKLYDGMALRSLADALRGIGYVLAGFDQEVGTYPENYPVVDAADYGAPQHRRRFILVGWRPNTLPHSFTWPLPTHGDPSASQTIAGSSGPVRHLPYVTVGEALSDLDFLTAGLESHIYKTAASSGYQRDRRKNTNILFNHLATQHRKTTVEMYRHLTQGATIRSVPEDVRTGKQTMRRLCESTPSKAVLALPDDLVHYRRHRIPTVREMARLQTFDDDYVFLGKRTTSDLGRRVDVPQYTQVGNAVPPVLGRALGIALVHALGAKPTDMRQLQVRYERHAWIHGSSAYLGYTLAEDAVGNIALLSVSGKPCPLPVADGDRPVAEQNRFVHWSKRPIRRRSRAAKK